MSRAIRKLDGASIALHGTFTPRSFHPAWFAGQGLLAPDEAQAAIPGDDGLLVVTGELTAWHAGWMSVQVTPERLALACDEVAHAAALASVMEGLVRALVEPRLVRLALHRAVHVQLASERDLRDFVQWLAPATPWATLMAAPLLRELQVAGGKHDAADVPFAISVRGSSRVTPFALHVQTCEEHAVGAAADVVEVLASSWAPALADADVAVERLFDGFFDSGA